MQCIRLWADQNSEEGPYGGVQEKDGEKESATRVTIRGDCKERESIKEWTS